MIREISPGSEMQGSESYRTLAARFLPRDLYGEGERSYREPLDVERACWFSLEQIRRKGSPPGKLVIEGPLLYPIRCPFPNAQLGELGLGQQSCPRVLFAGTCGPQSTYHNLEYGPKYQS
jgi:hypothetical protein